ncbi:hypothetical protein BH24GEM3_BH24GEM3_23800 [soil metagenome]|jgi:hypothetical protein
MSDAEPHRLVVDRFEGDLVVVEADGDRFLDLPRWLLPSRLREGDVVTAQADTGESGERRLVLSVDRAATQAARQEAEALLSRLRRRDPGGDIQL